AGDLDLGGIAQLVDEQRLPGAAPGLLAGTGVAGVAIGLGGLRAPSVGVGAGMVDGGDRARARDRRLEQGVLVGLGLAPDAGLLRGGVALRIKLDGHGRLAGGYVTVCVRPGMEPSKLGRTRGGGCCTATLPGVKCPVHPPPTPGSRPRRRAAPAQEPHPMGLDHVPTGSNVPEEINVVIEIPKDAEPVKYEVDKDSGAIFVDRILSTPMRYPCNYGYIPRTICGDGDPADVLVILPLPLIPGSVIRCRPVGVLRMRDEAGGDEKILAVPVDKVFAGYSHIDDISKVSPHWLERIGHFFEHYKDLEKGKWVKLDGWGGAAEARKILLEAIERYAALPGKQNF